MGAKGVKRPDLPCERSPPGGSSSLRSTAAEASTHITLETTRAIAALTRRTHRMAFSCQRGRVLRRFRQNACRVDTQNAQNADFLSTRPRCCRWNSEVLQVKRWSRLSTRRCAKARQNAHPEILQHAEKSRIAAKCSSCGAGTHFVASGPSKCSRWKGNASGNSPPYSLTISAVAHTSQPSQRPTKPRRSVVVAFTETRSSLTPKIEARVARMEAM